MGENVGFYLYNSAGEIIFATADITNTNDEQSIAAETAQLYLKGEMLVTNTARSNVVSGYSYKGPAVKEESRQTR